MVNILVAFSSRTSVTAKLAVGVGASNVGAFVRMRPVVDASIPAEAFEVPTAEDDAR